VTCHQTTASAGQALEALLLTESTGGVPHGYPSCCSVLAQAAKAAFKKVKELDKKRKEGQSALGAQDWATAERLFIEALHVGAFSMMLTMSPVCAQTLFC
jgi:hypothetical protein